MVVALGADIDGRIIIAGKGAVGRHEIIIGGGQRIAQLRGIAIGLMRVMASGADNADVRVAGGKRHILQQTQTDRPGMTPPAGIDAAGGVHIFDDLSMSAVGPFFVRGVLRIRMTTAANSGRHFDPRPDQRVRRIGGVRPGRSVAILTLDVGQWRSLGGTDKTCRQIEAHRMTSQTRAIGLAAASGEICVAKRDRVQGMNLRI